LAFRWSIQLSSNREPGIARPGLDVVHHDLLDARPRRAAPQGALEPLERLRLPLRNGLHASVVTIGDEAMETLAAGGVLREVAEPDALHTPAHNESPGDAHQAIIPQGFAGGAGLAFGSTASSFSRFSAAFNAGSCFDSVS
jgi:hypothetical protein